ncbi:hypothetical protein [Flavobacterium orientale]|uniref:tRNA modification GTPase n=1 Tax=Flavobacterium orientale TaxID=1756020 RepID=A0A916XYF1_9FLAO|nr:hypothetical protein [Flavobacterium orientale]GGD21179.1 hypothetical protein GCM10011343_09550 [Flavobacterium orientale]
MKNYILFTFLLVSLSLFSQNTWENGKIEFENGTSLDCQIKNENWSDNPESIKFLNQSNTEIIVDLKDLKSFEIFNKLKYIKASVDFETSSSKLDELTATREAVFEKKVLLLKMLIDAKADLFVYETNGKTRYFYRVDENPIKPLIFKSYLHNNTHVMTNKDFVYQLNTDVSCGDSKLAVNSINYREKELIKYFEKYNTCSNSTIVKYTQKNKSKLNINLFAGLSLIKSTFESGSDFYINNSSSNVSTFRAGSQFELILPLQKRNISAFAELSYLSLSTSYVETAAPNFTSNTSLDINKIDFLLGLKYYFFINEKSSIYLEGYYSITSLNAGKNELVSVLTTESDPDPIRTLILDARNEGYAGFGVGFKYDKKYSLGLRINAAQNSINYIYDWNQVNSEISIIAAYTIF